MSLGRNSRGISDGRSVNGRWGSKIRYGNTKDMVSISCKIPKEYVDYILNAIKRGIYLCKSEAYRHLISIGIALDSKIIEVTKQCGEII
jgi:hypothetical protein